MASMGATLALSDINLPGVLETQSLCANSSTHIASLLDVSSSSAVSEYFTREIIPHLQLQTTSTSTSNPEGKGEEKRKSLDYIFNCAGINPTAYPLTTTSDTYWDKLINTNLKGTYLISRAAIPLLSHSSSPSIVNVSSTMGLQAAPEYAIYCATKFGIVGFTKALALELGPQGIRVNAVAPGYIDTPSNAGVVAGPEAVQEQVDRVALGRMGTAEEVADVVAFLFSEESRYMTGAVVEITGGRM